MLECEFCGQTKRLVRNSLDGVEEYCPEEAAKAKLNVVTVVKAYFSGSFETEESKIYMETTHNDDVTLRIENSGHRELSRIYTSLSPEACEFMGEMLLRAANHIKEVKKNT